MYRIIVAYDGTAYHGWQVQPDQPTVAGELSRRFFEVFGRPVTIIGASRTDAGVHALGQVALVKTDLDIDPERLMRAWNGLLPSDIIIRSIERIGSAGVVISPSDDPESSPRDTFHPQRNVVQKTYWYHIAPVRPLPFMARYSAYYRFPFDVQKLQTGLELFVGTHDFRSFCTGDELATVRTIDRITVEYLKRYGVYRISVVGAGFARYMIRRLVGAALFVATRPDLPLTTLTDVLSACDPLHKLPTAPAHGLLLRRILYSANPSHTSSAHTFTACTQDGL